MSSANLPARRDGTIKAARLAGGAARRLLSLRACAAFLAVLAACPPGRSADWPTHRANPQRTGSLDDKPAPAAPKVRWAYRSQEHFIASPVVGAGQRGKVLYVSGLGPFNTPLFHCLSLGPGAPGEVLWTKTTPYVKRPMVCAPAVVDGLVVFGDGMHQTDGAALYCLRADNGRAVWQYPVPGKLVHLEGSPTVAHDRVFIGAGDAGVLCVALKRAVLDGREIDFAALDAHLAKRWAQLLAKYEQDKQKDPEFAIPPSDEALPKAAPKLIWQQGKKAWHVDAPVLVAGDRVLVASSYLDHEKVGKRSLLCLRAGDGKLLWDAPLKINPWAGPTLAGGLVLVGSSSIRFDCKGIPQAKGEVVAVDLATGRVRWRRDVPGGVLSPAAVRNDTAFFTATDGRIRAWQASTGQPKWAYQAGAAFFAGCALAGGMVYAADLRGVVHAVRQADGTKAWSLNLGTHAAVQLPGMAFSSPIVHDGELYVATCNLAGPHAEQPCAVVCLSEKAASLSGAAAQITVDKSARSVIVPCRIAPRKLPTLKEIYPLEVVATYPAPRGQKAHETVVIFEVKPSEVHKAMESFGLKPGTPARGEGPPPTGPLVTISMELLSVTGKRLVIPIENVMVDRRTGRPLPPLQWHFTGSAMRQPDPDKDERVYGADLSGTLISLFPVTDETIFQANLSMRDGNLLKLEVNKNVLPEEGTPVRLIIKPKSRRWWEIRTQRTPVRHE